VYLIDNTAVTDPNSRQYVLLPFNECVDIFLKSMWLSLIC